MNNEVKQSEIIIARTYAKDIKKITLKNKNHIFIKTYIIK